ncbi:MAG: DUF4352 domain-containing protein [Acidimicrobiales bacterium]|nr:DUF4352 domain-containing protein [Acidimicrobiales bacterium]
MRHRISLGGLVVSLAAMVLLGSGCADEADTTLAGSTTDQPTTTTSARPTTTTEAATTTEEETTTTTEPPTTTTTTEPPTTTSTEATTTTEESTTTTEDTTTTEQAAQDVYAVGETAHTGVFDVTVHQVVSPWESGNEFEVPLPGRHFVAVEASLVNVDGAEVEVWSSLLGAEVTDSQGRPWETAFAGFDLPMLDGDVGLGMTRRGWVVFEVADDATGLLLRIAGSPTATGSLFDLGV